MSDAYLDSARKPALTRLSPDVHAAARAVAEAHHQSLGAYIALVVENDLRARLDDLQGMAS